jgi:hypothetical protein
MSKIEKNPVLLTTEFPIYEIGGNLTKKQIDDLMSQPLYGGLMIRKETRYGNPELNFKNQNVWLKSKWVKYFEKLLEKHNPWGVNWDSINPQAHLLKYSKGGWIRRHIDFDWRKEPYDKMTISVVTGVSKNLKGGGFRVGEDKILEPVVGQLIILPSIVQHEVLPIEQGWRTSCIVWAQGPAFV